MGIKGGGIKRRLRVLRWRRREMKGGSWNECKDDQEVKKYKKDPA